MTNVCLLLLLLLAVVVIVVGWPPAAGESEPNRGGLIRKVREMRSAGRSSKKETIISRFKPGHTGLKPHYLKYNNSSNGMRLSTFT